MVTVFIPSPRPWPSPLDFENVSTIPSPRPWTSDTRRLHKPLQSPSDWTPGALREPDRATGPVRVLKVMAAFAQSAAPVKNYHLELLTLLAQDAAVARGGARVADGSMQLVQDVLQSIADGKMPTSSAAESHIDLSEDQFGGLVSKLKVTLLYGHPGPGSLKRPFNSDHLVFVIGMSVLLENLALVVPDLPGVSFGHHCIYLIAKAQLQARGCVFSSPNAPCIGIGDSGTHCRLIDCCFGPDKERGASAGVVVADSSNLVAERCLFQRCREGAVEVRGTGSTACLKGCKFIKCKKRAIVLYAGGKELEMDDCLIQHCGDTKHSLLHVACGTAKLCKCSFVNNNNSAAVMVQCEDGQSAPVLDMRECILKGNMNGVSFGFGLDGISGGSGILVNNQITDHALLGLSVNMVAPYQTVKLIDNVFRGNGTNAVKEKMDICVVKNVEGQVEMENNSGAVLISPFTAKLQKCSFVNNNNNNNNNNSAAVMVQCDDGRSAPVLDMRECNLKGNMNGVSFGFGLDGISGGSGILVNNQITDHAQLGLGVNMVAPNWKVQLINVF
eukprot:gene7580-734_t